MATKHGRSARWTGFHDSRLSIEVVSGQHHSTTEDLADHRITDCNAQEIAVWWIRVSGAVQVLYSIISRYRIESHLPVPDHHILQAADIPRLFWPDVLS